LLLSFRQQEIEREIKKALDARIDSFRDEFVGEMQKMLEAIKRASGLTDEEIAAGAQLRKLSDLA
jgi:hypothetical protein